MSGHSRRQPEIRQATAEDLVAFYGYPQERSTKAFVAVLDGKPVAIAGVCYEGRGRPPRFYSEMKPEMRPYRKAIVRGARLMLDSLRGMHALAIASQEEPGSVRLLLHLGFKYLASNSQGDIFVWRG